VATASGVTGRRGGATNRVAAHNDAAVRTTAEAR